MTEIAGLKAKYSPPNVNYWGDRCCKAEAEIERLRAAQWPDEVTDEMKKAVYVLNLGKNRLSEDDVIDIYDTFRKIVNEQEVTEK